MTTLLSTFIGNYGKSCSTTHGEVKLEKAIQLYAEEHECIVVVDNKKPTGLLLQDRIYARLSTLYGPFLYPNKPVEKMMHKNMLLVDEKSIVSEVMERIHEA